MDGSFATMGLRLMQGQDLRGGVILWQGKTIPASIGDFSAKQDLMAGGFSPHVSTTITVALCDLVGLSPKSSQLITVTPNYGPARDCKIETVRFQGPLVDIDVIDESEGA